MAGALERIWKDAVGSKLIASVIQGFIVVVFIPALYLAWAYFGGLTAILLTVGVIAIVGLVFILVWRTLNRRRPQIERVGDVDVNFDEAAFFSLKCWVQLRNEAAECADVRIISYMPHSVHLKRFVPDVLQIRLGNEWYPPHAGVDRIAVLPGQLFQAWVGVDEKSFNKDQVRALRGQIGSLTFRVNDKPVNMNL
jgi:hypothetical protein